MNKKFIYLLLAFSLSLFVFTSCSDDDDPANLTLETNETGVIVGGTTTVKITEGNGDYKAVPADATIATADVSGTTITITGVKAGTTNITVTDKENKTSVLKVTVSTMAEYVAATYSGELAVTLENAQEPEKSTNDIVLAKSGENVKMTLANFTFSDIPVSNVIVDEIPVTKGENGAINIVETTKAITVKVGDDDIPVDVTVSGTVATKAKTPKANIQVETEQVLDLTIKVVVPTVGDVNVTFSGPKKAAN